ncbi:MAG: hypothetical protein JWO86_2188 [Myxococcaceae bacterium]|nr:hypothetical protein [Myxococcaceae bacterium]
MDHRRFALVLVLGTALAGLCAAAAGCGDDEVFKATDAGSFEASVVPETGTTVTPDGGDSAAPSTCGNPTGAPERLLLTVNGTTSEVAAFNLGTKTVDGRFEFEAGTGQTFSFGTDPYVVEQGKDVVARMNAQRPWEAVATWNVAGDDRTDGGPNAQPVAVVVPSCEKGYVLRFESNKIAVIDTTKVGGDAGAIESYIDLSSLVQPTDTDNRVEMTSALYVPSKKLIYVLLGNWDRNNDATDGFTAHCATSKPSIIAIDPATDQVVSLGGTAPGGGITVDGYSPALGNALVYDAARDRMLVFNSGCNADTGGGVAGAVTRRSVDEANLATKQSKTLLDLNGLGFPGTLALLDGNRAALTLFFPNQAFFWDPSTTTLGPEIPGALDYGAFDSKGNFVGGRRATVDGGAVIEVRSVPFTSGDGGIVDAGAVQTLGTNPFTKNSGFIGGAEVWPRP